MPTIKEVAKAACVSVATVSRVLNHDAKVSEHTRKQVLSVVQQMGYTPNMLGRNLRVSSTRKILVLLPSLSNQYYSSIITGIENVARLHQYQVMTSSTHSNVEIEKDYIAMLYNKSIDGIILLSSEQSAEELTAIAQKYPIVMCSEYTHGAQLSCVGIDNFQAAFDAVSYLIHIGHKKIAIISNAQVDSACLRTKGYQDALQSNDLPVLKECIINTEYSFQSGMLACKKLLKLKNPPTAVFAISDVLAAGVIKYLYSVGKQPGKDMAVFGFDNTSLAKMITPTLSTISQPRNVMGQKAMELLVDKINDIHSENRRIVLEHNLVIRETTINL